MKESDFRRELRKSYEKTYGAACFTISFPSMYIEGGIADLLVCLSGNFLSIECKLVKELPKDPSKNMLKYGFTELQCRRAQDVARAGGRPYGIICVRPLMDACVLPIECFRTDFVLAEIDMQLYKRLSWDKRDKLWRGLPE